MFCGGQGQRGVTAPQWPDYFVALFNRPSIRPTGQDALSSPFFALLNAAVMSGAKRLQVAHIPKQRLVALVGLDVVAHGRGCDPSLVSAHAAERIGT